MIKASRKIICFCSGPEKRVNINKNYIGTERPTWKPDDKTSGSIDTEKRSETITNMRISPGKEVHTVANSQTITRVDGAKLMPYLK